MPATELPTETVTLDQIFDYRDGSNVLWISCKTSDGYLTVERKCSVLRSFHTLQAAVAKTHGVQIENPRYASSKIWQHAVTSARLRGLHN